MLKNIWLVDIYTYIKFIVLSRFGLYRLMNGHFQEENPVLSKMYSFTLLSAAVGETRYKRYVNSSLNRGAFSRVVQLGYIQMTVVFWFKFQTGLHAGKPNGCDTILAVCDAVQLHFNGAKPCCSCHIRFWCGNRLRTGHDHSLFFTICGFENRVKNKQIKTALSIPTSGISILVNGGGVEAVICAELNADSRRNLSPFCYKKTLCEHTLRETILDRQNSSEVFQVPCPRRDVVLRADVTWAEGEVILWNPRAERVASLTESNVCLSRRTMSAIFLESEYPKSSANEPRQDGGMLQTHYREKGGLYRQLFADLTNSPGGRSSPSSFLMTPHKWCWRPSTRQIAGCV